MSDALFSPSWYRVANLKPKLRHHGEVHRHDYRGKVWFVLQDHVSGRSQRFTPQAYHFIGLMNGQRNVQELWDIVNQQAGDQAPTQDDVIRLLSQLHSMDLLICDVSPDTQELFRRSQRQKRTQLKQRLWSPLAIRIPLIDPDKFLERTLPVARLFLNRYTALVWLITVILGAVFAIVHWNDLTENVIDRALTPQNLLLLWFIYPVVKAFHELGHAYLTKKYGGEVHEIGIMFLVFVPVPYVDASSIWGFRDKRKRMAVGAAGIAAEIFLGSLALFIWLSVEIGTVHAIAYNVMLISGISTLFFNGNPLLRFDGYYVLADALEIPNLGNRSTKYLGYLFQRYLFGIKQATSPADNSGERFWFVFYGIAAFLYRMFIMFVIILYVGGKFFAIGVILAIWAVISQMLIPLGKNISFLLTSPKVKPKRLRSNLVAGGLLASILVLLFMVQAPYWTRVEGVIWPPEQSKIRAGADGFIDTLLVADGSTVRTGDPIIQAIDPIAKGRVKVLEARLEQLNIQLTAARTVDRVQTGIIQEELYVVQEDLNRARKKLTELLIRSPGDGLLVIPQSQHLTGRFVRKGESIGFVVDPTDQVKVRAVVPQDDIGLVRQAVYGVDVIAANHAAISFPATILREVHGGSNQLPTAALGDMGGGSFVVSPADNQGLTTLERVFEIELGLPDESRSPYLGGRIYVRFDHGHQSLGMQMWLRLRQLFLRRFNV